MVDDSLARAVDVSVSAPSKARSWGWLSPTKWIETIGGVVTGGLGYAPRDHVGIIVIEFLVAVVALLIGLGSIYAGYGSISVLSVVLAFVVLGVGMFFIRPKEVAPGRTSNVQVTQPSAGRETRSGRWSRVMVNLPISQSTLNVLGTKLDSIRALAQNKYRELLEKRGINVASENVRVNMFLPDNREAVELGDVCGLYIPRGLHRGMKNDDECRIRFRTNEGLTGRVYTEQRPLGARRSGPKAEWEAITLQGMGKIEDGKFQLTQQQVGLIDKDLRWIVSIPLSAEKGGVTHTLGVFNIDGLSEILEVNDMQSLYQALQGQVDQLTSDLEKERQCLVTIFVDSLSN